METGRWASQAGGLSVSVRGSWDYGNTQELPARRLVLTVLTLEVKYNDAVSSVDHVCGISDHMLLRTIILTQMSKSKNLVIVTISDLLQVLSHVLW